MTVKRLSSVDTFTAGDLTQIQEILHPKNDAVTLPYSLAYATLAKSKASVPHVLQTSVEVYFILEGTAKAYIGTEVTRVQKGDLVLIPAGVKQYIENTGESSLHFLCIVSPPWSKEDEIVD
jgi:mannose-6-phosphate isomerase-like protein (cupin superfamily)